MVMFSIAGYSSDALQQFPPITLYKKELQLVHQPTIDKDTTVELGQTLVSKSFIQKIPAISINKSIEHTANHGGFPIPMTVSSGHLTRWGYNDLGIYYKATNFSATNSNSGYGSKPIVISTIGGLVVPNEKTSASIIFRYSESTGRTYINEMETPIFIEVIEDAVIPHINSFQKELIYTGVSRNTITLVYREYINDFARPAFTQELKYDLADGDIIGFKGARFQIIKATNIGIQYKVLKYLD